MNSVIQINSEPTPAHKQVVMLSNHTSRKHTYGRYKVFQSLVEVVMSPLFRYAWPKLRDAKVTKYALLVLTPIFIKPSDFEPSRIKKRPPHARVKDCGVCRLLLAELGLGS
jgi:hypothetical protein